jgi:hypothetical protein
MQKEFQLLKPFSKVRCKDVGTLILTQGEVPALTIDADEGLFEKLMVEVHGDSLVLGLDESWQNQIEMIFSSMFFKDDRKVTYYLTVPDLRQVSISGKIDLNCDSFTSDDFKLNVSGLGKLNFGHLECRTLEVTISGRGEFYAAGHADHQSIRISGSGEYQAPNLASQSGRIVISGQGNATLRVDDSLEIIISGMGQVNYYGQPKLRQVISGMGKSKRLSNC